MKFIKLNCNNCDAQLDIDLDNIQAYCSHCGQKLLLDMEQMSLVITEKEKTKRIQEQTRRAQERTKQIQMEYDYKKYKEKEENKSLIAMFALLIGLFVVIGLGIFAIELKTDYDHKDKNEIQVNISSEELIELNYEEAKIALESAGFANISVIEENDLVIGLLAKEGDVKSVSINGKTTFNSSDWFPLDSTVRIVYHAY